MVLYKITHVNYVGNIYLLQDLTHGGSDSDFFDEVMTPYFIYLRDVEKILNPAWACNAYCKNLLAKEKDNILKDIQTLNE
jgi:hypothetical protein